MRIVTSVLLAAMLPQLAQAAVVPNRFQATSEVLFESDQLGYASIGRTDLGSLDADLDSPADGRVRTQVSATASTFSVISTMGVSTDLNGRSSGWGVYDIDGSQNVVVDWNWLDISLAGGWEIRNAANAVVASFTFSAGNLVSTGGSFGSSASGVASVALAAGQYKFVSIYQADTMPSGAQVNFNFAAVPVPGTIVLLAAAGVVGVGRRRR